MSVSREKPMTSSAIVIEKAENGIIVRPHRGWWQAEENTLFTSSSVLVFNNLDDFGEWFAKYFPTPEPPGVCSAPSAG
jgi:hypothetical protein